MSGHTDTFLGFNSAGHGKNVTNSTIKEEIQIKVTNRPPKSYKSN